MNGAHSFTEGSDCYFGTSIQPSIVKIAPLAGQIKSECHSLISLWRAELESREAVAKLQSLRK